MIWFGGKMSDNIPITPEHENLLLRMKERCDKEYYKEFTSKKDLSDVKSSVGNSVKVLYGLITIFLALTVYNLRYTHTFDLAQVSIKSRVVILENRATEMNNSLNSIETSLNNLTTTLLGQISRNNKRGNSNGS